MNEDIDLSANENVDSIEDNVVNEDETRVEDETASEPENTLDRSTALNISNNSQVQQRVKEIESKTSAELPTTERKRKHADEGDDPQSKKGRGSTPPSTNTPSLGPSITMTNELQDHITKGNKELLEAIGLLQRGNLATDQKIDTINSKMDTLQNQQDADRNRNNAEFNKIHLRQDKFDQAIIDMRHERQSEGTCQGMQLNDVTAPDMVKLLRAKRSFQLEGVAPTPEGDVEALDTAVRDFLLRVAAISPEEVNGFQFEEVKRITRWQRDPADPTKDATRQPTRGVIIVLPETAQQNGQVKCIAKSRYNVNKFNEGEANKEDKCHIWDTYPDFVKPLHERLRIEARQTRLMGFLKTTVRWTNCYTHLTVWVMSNPDNNASKGLIKTWIKREEAVNKLGPILAREWMDKRAFYANRQSIST